MGRFAITSKAGKYTWLQVLCLGISIVAYMANSMLVAVAMLIVGTIFGVVAMRLRLQEAKRAMGQMPRTRRR